MTDYLLVEQPDSLCARLDALDVIGVDTEFMREKTFFAELCLLQIATGDDIYCVDPLTDSSADEFWDSATGRAWVLHSARQDIEVIYQTSRQMPERIFDTQIAAGLLGMPPQLGYANLVNELFGIDIPKSHTRADWSKRPLADALLRYAAEDVEYLLPAYDVLCEALDKKGRLGWAREDSAALLDPALYDTDPKTAIQRLKGGRNLRGRKRAAAARLAAWRESEALRANRPRQWIVRDPVLIELANTLPTSVDALEHIDGLASGVIRRSGQQLLDVISRSGNDNNDYRPPAAPNETQKALLRTLQQQVADCAADLDLPAETIASKKELSGVVMSGDRDSRVLSGWRREIIGEELLQFL